MNIPISKTTPIRACVVSIALSIAFGSAGASMERRSAQTQKVAGGGTTHSYGRMADGKQWTTANLNVNTSPPIVTTTRKRIAVDMAVCIRGNRPSEDVNRWGMDGGCRPTTNGETWRSTMVDSVTMADKGRAAYTTLLLGGTSGFNAVLGGNRSPDGQYARSEAHGFYWTASENDSASAPFYNFAKGSQALYRQSEGEKQMAISVRCVREFKLQESSR